MLLDKQINKQTKKYGATLALNEYLLSRREVSYSASICTNQSPEKIREKKWEIKPLLSSHGHRLAVSTRALSLRHQAPDTAINHV